MLLGVYSDSLMNSDEFKLICSSDTESEEDFTFNGFSEQDLIMGNISSSSKKHSKTKTMPTAVPSVQENVEATLQDEHCVRPCENPPKPKQKSFEDRPHGPNPGMSSETLLNLHHIRNEGKLMIPHALCCRERWYIFPPFGH